MKAAARAGHAINPDFETDGELNLGAREDWPGRAAWALRKTPDSPRVSAHDIGALVPEGPINHEVEPIHSW